MPVAISQFDRVSDVSDWIGEIKEVWSRGASSTMELARVVSLARKRLAYGQWEQVLKSLPFGKTKANMLITIGKRLAWLDGQTFGHLPVGWSILYQLAQLDRVTFERLIQEEAIHPKLKLQEAKDLVAKFKGRPNKKKSRRTSLKQRLQRFGDFVSSTMLDWSSEERELVESELTRLLELIQGGAGESLERHVGDDRTDHRPDRRIFTTRRTVTPGSPQQSETR